MIIGSQRMGWSTNIKQIHIMKNKLKKLFDKKATFKFGPIRVSKTVYPHGKKQMSLTGDSEFYGLQEGKL